MQPIYNTIGTGYNSTRQADPYVAGRLLDLLSPVKDGLYLDIGCGTGNYTNELASKGFSLCGIDPSEKMLTEARQKNSNIEWLNATAEEMPFDDTSFDGVIATLTIHHWKDLPKAFREIHHVLKPGGRIVIFTSTPGQMQGYWLNHYFPKMLEASIAQMPSLESIENACNAAGLKITQTEKYFVQDDLQDHFLYVGKNRPALYLEEGIRNGISSFAALSNTEEVEKGLTQLKEDVAHNKFAFVQQHYENEEGDYLFVVVEKTN